MNDDLNLKLLGYKHQAIMAKRDIINGKNNHDALVPLFKHVEDNKDVSIISKIHKEFIMRIMLKFSSNDNVNNVDDISSNEIIYQLNILIYSIQHKL